MDVQSFEWRWKYFEPKEVLSPDGLVSYAAGHFMLQPDLLDAVEEFREAIDVPLLCNVGTLLYRGYRSPTENRRIGGKEFSRHVQGLALDVSSKKMTPKDIAARAREFGFPGVGLYERMSFVHLDLRPCYLGHKAFWIV